MTTLDEIQTLLNQRAHVRIFYHHTDKPAFEGHIVGLYDHPTIVVQDADGRQHTVSSQLRIETVRPAEPPRDGTPWLDPAQNDVWRGMGDCWWRIGNEFAHRWPEVCRVTDPAKWQRLIPDPADSAPGFPWQCLDDDGDRLRIMPLTGSHIEISVTVEGHYRAVNIEPEAAEVAAGVLLRAAREARQL